MISIKTMGSSILLTAGLLASAPSEAVVTQFATFTAYNYNLAWRNNCCSSTNATWRSDGTGGALFTTSAAVPVRPEIAMPGAAPSYFSFTNPALAPLGTIAASFSLFASAVAQPAQPFLGFNFQPNVNGTFSFLSTTPLRIGATNYAPGANLLSGSFTGLLIYGANRSTAANALASPSIGGVVTYSSDFLDFTSTVDREFSLSVPVLRSFLNDHNEGLSFTSGHALRSFRGAVAGGFSAGPAPMLNNVPEPQVWALLVIGFGLVGVQIRRRGGQLITTAPANRNT